MIWASRAVGPTSWSSVFNPSRTATAYSRPPADARVTSSPHTMRAGLAVASVAVAGGFGNRAVNTPRGSAKSVGRVLVMTRYAASPPAAASARRARSSGRRRRGFLAGGGVGSENSVWHFGHRTAGPASRSAAAWGS